MDGNSLRDVPLLTVKPVGIDSFLYLSEWLPPYQLRRFHLLRPSIDASFTVQAGIHTIDLSRHSFQVRNQWEH